MLFTHVSNFVHKSSKMTKLFRRFREEIASVWVKIGVVLDQSIFIRSLIYQLSSLAHEIFFEWMVILKFLILFCVWSIYVFSAPFSKKVCLNVHFNSRRTCMWSLSIPPIFAEVRLKEFWMLQTAKWLFFNILAFLSVLKVILVNRCWPDVSQINFTWKFTSKGSENIFESFSYLQYSRSYD